MNDINVAYLQAFLSGGVSNAGPNSSLGGEISDERIISQTGTGITHITGVTIDSAAGNAEGIGILAYDAADNTMNWTPNGSTVGADVTVLEDGLYGVTGLNGVGLIVVNVDFDLLPETGLNTDNITISNVVDNLFDDISKSDSFNGSIDYRAYFLKNVHPTDPFLDIVLFMGQQPTPGTVAFGVDPAGKGDGESSSIPQLIANEKVAPSGVTFSTASSEPGGVHVNQLDPGECILVWLRRTITARNTVSNAESVTVVSAQAYF